MVEGILAALRALLELAVASGVTRAQIVGELDAADAKRVDAEIDVLEEARLREAGEG